MKMHSLTGYSFLNIIKCISLKEYRKFFAALQRKIASALERKFSSGLDRRLELPGRQIQLVDIGLALAPPLDRQEPKCFQRFQMRPHTAIGQAQILSQALLAGKAVIVLPGIGEQHCEGHLVAGAEPDGLQEKIRDLGEALRGGGVGALENDGFLFQQVPDAAYCIHARIIRAGIAQALLIPCPPASRPDRPVLVRPRVPTAASASSAIRQSGDWFRGRAR